MALSRDWEPLRDSFGNIHPSQFKHLDQRPIPEVSVAVTTSQGTQSYPLASLCEAGFVIAFSMGGLPQTQESAVAKSGFRWTRSTPLVDLYTHGLYEIHALHSLVPELNKLSYQRLLIVTPQSVAEQRQLLAEHNLEFTPNSVWLVSDPGWNLAKALKLFPLDWNYTNSATHTTKNITIVDSIIMWGKENKIQDYVCKGMALPLTRLALTSIQKQAEKASLTASTSNYNPRQFQQAKAAGNTAAPQASELGWGASRNSLL
jgi:hypothetical protein